ncbi:MAG: PDZ domain-containing protein [Planctomycetota bacterium]|nr:PDZ domain-containing protein [Planctomycetota bacterium]MDA1251416.1 PDZ domain-containing protein [Planctomycetota bacterium]
MNSFRTTAALVTFATLLGSAIAQTSQEDLELAEEQAFKQAAALASPSIVRIDTVGGLDVVGQIQTSTAPTSGVILTEDGYVISSAFNFISKPASVLITLPDGKRLPARIIATDRLRMVTLLKVEATGLPVPKVVNKDTVEVGQWAVALGRTYDSPLPSMSVGIVSAVNRIWGRAVQTDAKISPVNYGGPLVDVNGGVIGILAPLSPQGNTETAGVEWYDSGIGFAIPLEDIYRTLPRLKKGEDLRPGQAGISLKSKDIYAADPVIDRVRYDSPAWNAGLRPDDLVVEVEGKPVQRIAQVMMVIRSRLEGERVALKVKRGEEIIAVDFELAGELTAYEMPFLGILPQRDGEAGVGVRHVYKESAAEKAGLKPRDRIVTYDGQAVATAKELLNLVSRARPDDEAKIEVVRGTEPKATLTLKLTTVLNTIPEGLTSSVIPAPEKGAVDEETKRGRFTEKLPGYEQELWAIVPDLYNPDHGYGLVVFLHPAGDTMEATIVQEWKSLCEQRGLILLAPKAEKIESGFTDNESDYVRDAVVAFQDRYNIDPARIVVHSYGNGAAFAATVAFKYRELFRAVLLAGAPLSKRPPENQPDLSLQFHFMCGAVDPAMAFSRLSLASLKSLKFPATLRIVEGLAHKYPAEAVEEAASWIDALDRL